MEETMMQTEIITDNEEELKFTMYCEVQISNSIRRTIMSDIPVICFDKFFVYQNDTIFNNEIIKQRLSALPLLQDNQDLDVTFTCNITNTDEEYICITPEYLIPSIEDVYFDSSICCIPLLYVRKGETIHFVVKRSINTAGNNGLLNVASKVVFKPVTKNLDGMTKSHQIKELVNNSSKYTVENFYEFTIETVGQYTNKNLFNKAIHVLIEKLQNLDYIIKSENKSFKIILRNEGYTIGKVIELYLSKILGDNCTFHSFNKKDQYIQDGEISLGVKNKVDIEKELSSSITSLIETYKSYVF